MHTLSTTEKRTLAEIIYFDTGPNVDYLSFIEIALSMFEDISGFEISPPDIDLLNELWHIYRSFAT